MKEDLCLGVDNHSGHHRDMDAGVASRDQRPEAASVEGWGRVVDGRMTSQQIDQEAPVDCLVVIHKPLVACESCYKVGQVQAQGSRR
jgi:hypothetical protein